MRRLLRVIKVPFIYLIKIQEERRNWLMRFLSNSILMRRLLRPIKWLMVYLIQTKEDRRHWLVDSWDNWKLGRDFHIQFLKGRNLQPAHYLLDIGCGTLRGGLPLINYLQEGHYFGIEVRENALNEGRKEIMEANLEGKQPKLFLSPDISELIIEQQFDYIIAFWVLIHLTDEILNNTLAFVSKHLSKQGVFYANVNIGDREKGSWREFPVVWRPFQFYSQACAAQGLLVSDLGTVKDQGHITNIEIQDTQRILKITKHSQS